MPPAEGLEQRKNIAYSSGMIVDEIGKDDCGLLIRCRVCGHRAYLTPSQAIDRFGSAAALEELPARVRCGSCRHRGARHFAVTVTDELSARSPYLAFAGSPQAIRCFMCWHQEVVQVEDALIRFGAEATFHWVRQNGRCQQCGVAGALRIGPVLDEHHPRDAQA